MHDVDLGEVARIELELLLLGGAQRAVVGVAHRRERDPLAVGRVAALGVVAPRVGQPLQRAGLLVVRVDVHLRVVVPRVAALLARRAERELLVLVLLRLRIVVRRREQDLVAVRAGRTRRSSCRCRARCAWCRRSPGRARRSGRTDCPARARSGTPGACRRATSSLRRRACLRRSAAGRGSGNRVLGWCAGCGLAGATDTTAHETISDGQPPNRLDTRFIQNLDPSWKETSILGSAMTAPLALAGLPVADVTLALPWPRVRGARDVRMVEVAGEGAKYWPRWRGPSGQGHVAGRAIHRHAGRRTPASWKIRGARPRQLVADRLGRSDLPDDRVWQRRAPVDARVLAHGRQAVVGDLHSAERRRVRALQERLRVGDAGHRWPAGLRVVRPPWARSRSTSTARSPGSTSSAILDNYHGPAGSPVLYKDRIFIYQDANPAPGQSRVRRRVRQGDRQADLADAAARNGRLGHGGRDQHRRARRAGRQQPAPRRRVRSGDAARSCGPCAATPTK